MPKLKTEQQHQEALVKWFRLQYPRYKDLLTLASFGEDVGPRRMAALKRMGLVPGHPDLVLFVPAIRKVKQPKKWYEHFMLMPTKFEFFVALSLQNFVNLALMFGDLAAFCLHLDK